jgi:hypothetical protein
MSTRARTDQLLHLSMQSTKVVSPAVVEFLVRLKPLVRKLTNGCNGHSCSRSSLLGSRSSLLLGSLSLGGHLAAGSETQMCGGHESGARQPTAATLV